MKLLCIAIGGAIGALARYGLGGLVQRLAGGVLPWGTLAVNLLGSFVIGLLAAVFSERIVSENLRIGLLIGVLGAFTTFSTFSLETVQLVQDRQYAWAAANVAGSCALGIALVFAGLFAGRALLGIWK
ncbi:MAG TPA: fluoride efflux transporter CrcB [Phycisphaerales bacterium]|nr:fluoride efflux transporter CrcB [Phycisphaerales bacterium]